MMSDRELIDLAIEARNNAYTPYSDFKVGAALLSKEGKVYKGCNIENAAYTPTNCAERTAFFKAVSEGVTDFKTIAIVGGYDKDGLKFCPPCGVCRQVMMEFCESNKFRILLLDEDDEIKSYLLKDILPFGFGPKNL
jgi:cytidine deaminase